MALINEDFDDFVKRNLGAHTKASSAAATPEWMIMIDDLLSSTIEGTTNQTPDDSVIDYKKCAQVFDWERTQSRLTQDMAGSNQFSSGTVTQNPIFVQIVQGSYIPVLVKYMQEGKNIQWVHLIRLAQNTDTVPQERISCKNSTIEIVHRVNDQVFLAIRPTVVWDDYIEIDQDGTNVGHVSNAFDFTTGKAPAGA